MNYLEHWSSCNCWISNNSRCWSRHTGAMCRLYGDLLSR